MIGSDRYISAASQHYGEDTIRLRREYVADLFSSMVTQASGEAPRFHRWDLGAFNKQETEDLATLRRFVDRAIEESPEISRAFTYKPSDDRRVIVLLPVGAGEMLIVNAEEAYRDNWPEGIEIIDPAFPIGENPVSVGRIIDGAIERHGEGHEGQEGREKDKAANPQADGPSKDEKGRNALPEQGFSVVLFDTNVRKKTIEETVVNITRHGEGHIDQEGRSPEQGGSKKGYKHAGGGANGDGKKPKRGERWEKGSWTAVDGKARSTRVYHGTANDLADEIAKEGLRRGTFDPAGREPSVYFATSQEFAAQYGSYMAAEEQEYGDDPSGGPLQYAVIEFEIPAEVGEKVIRDTIPEAWRLEQDIPSDWIKAIHYYESGQPPKTIPINSQELAERHGDHEGQEGRKGQRGGSQAGYSHVGVAEKESEAGEAPGVKATASKFNQAFTSAMKDNERAAFVTHYSEKELADMEALYLSEDGKSGLAVLDRGDGKIEVTAAFNDGAPKGTVLKMMEQSIREDGVNYAEAFGPFLPAYYSDIGFKTVDRFPFDAGQAPKNWNYELHGRPNYHIMEVGK
jgi:hypothetical protein